METPTIKHPNPNQTAKVLDFPLKSHTNSHSHSPTFLQHNGFNSTELPISDIEMIAIQSVEYTSLKDLLPLSSLSPTHNSSWYDEIPIKNPLVKHAALAYLQPMSTPREAGDKGFFGRLREQYCSCEGGCLWWLGYVVSIIKEAFRERRDILYYAEDEGEEDEDDDDDDEKVD
ncbi:hypothetical protein I3843_05G077600 [Carya illinoinensis]|uniref:Uncharacterized protein n=1 Tax=Carya illinoinensis TaxID=32201 RepID=A0A8T1QGA1_CARIL|nr:uncharacterized protein LOC122309359 [Carya illinoinensis]KAG2706083.1 hypothetical protein I3760_05G087600 [Carya illinoinensis]KAG6653558.1 hypothetical protein CIPAW_05G085600 [Carya illinoinensis]KAG6712015.1 hypothetical protein I3842_05G084100 [Carya illinoinensis]KAG7978340.1 hypothetical protein I3843_05G077600 [Carya illinoinensis]